MTDLANNIAIIIDPKAMRSQEEWLAFFKNKSEFTDNNISPELLAKENYNVHSIQRTEALEKAREIIKLFNSYSE